jgi:hypothetical protein
MREIYGRRILEVIFFSTFLFSTLHSGHESTSIRV